MIACLCIPFTRLSARDAKYMFRIYHYISGRYKDACDWSKNLDPSTPYKLLNFRFLIPHFIVKFASLGLLYEWCLNFVLNRVGKGGVVGALNSSGPFSPCCKWSKNPRQRKRHSVRKLEDQRVPILIRTLA